MEKNEKARKMAQYRQFYAQPNLNRNYRIWPKQDRKGSPYQESHYLGRLNKVRLCFLKYYTIHIQYFNLSLSSVV